VVTTSAIVRPSRSGAIWRRVTSTSGSSGMDRLYPEAHLRAQLERGRAREPFGSERAAATILSGLLMRLSLALLALGSLLGCGASTSAAGSGLRGPPDKLPPTEYAGAAADYQHACRRGVADACAYLGYMQDNGFGIAKDTAAGVSLCERACSSGSAYGCAYLGYLFRLGRGVAQDDERAAQLFRRACDGDDLGGCVGLAIMYKSGSGVPRDLDYAARLFRGACDKGEALACYSLGYMYANGDIDMEQAARLFRSACDSGDRVGCEAAERLR
jgi:TPR repeat protein